MKIHIEFSGGLELLIKDKKKNHDVEFEGDLKTLKSLVSWIKDTLITERAELFVVDGSIRPGVLVLINDCDWELTGGIDSVVSDKDTVVFISTLHGG